MDIRNDIDWKSLLIGSAVTAAIFIVATSPGYDWLILFSSIGLLYVGWTSKDIKYGIVLGAIATLPMMYITLVMKKLGTDPFYSTTNGIITVIILFALLGAFTGFVGAWAKRSREKAKVEYEKQQKIGKNKKKKKNNN